MKEQYSSLSHPEVQATYTICDSLDEVSTDIDKWFYCAKKIEDSFKLRQTANFLVRVDLGPILDADQDGIFSQRLVLDDELTDCFDQRQAKLAELLMTMKW